MKKTHTTKCKSNFLVIFGDARNYVKNPFGKCDCDGYHTFDELYEHRFRLYIALCEVLLRDCGHCSFATKPEVWRSKMHSDGTQFDGWFLLGIAKQEGEQITYHLPVSYWLETEFAETLERAPKFDGHTSDDVLKRLESV